MAGRFPAQGTGLERHAASLDEIDRGFDFMHEGKYEKRRLSGEEEEMFSHMMVGSNDIDRSRTFYDALFGAVGGKPGRTDDHGRLMYLHNGGVFMITKPIDGQPACRANGATIGFAMDSAEQADAWHKSGVENGGTAIEDDPGIREGKMGRLYLAYLRDPDGNKLCAMHRVA